MWKAKLTVLALTVSFLLSGCSDGKQATSEAMLYTGEMKEEEQQEIETVTVERGSYIENVVANAKLYYLKEVSVLVDVENAELDEIKVEVGDKVKKGDIIATYKVHLSKTKMEREKLEIDNERSKYDAEYKAKQNEITECKRQLKNMKKGEQRTQIKLQLKQMQQQLVQFKLTESSIIEREKSYQQTLANSKKTKLVSKYSGIVSKVQDSDELGFEMGTEVVTLRTEDDFLIEVEDTEGALRYNMEVTVALGGDQNDIRHRLKGKVISSANLIHSDDESSEEGGSTVYVKISKENRKKYDFSKNNIYVEYEKMCIENCLLVDNDAIAEETEGADTKYYVWIVNNGNLYKRYIKKAFAVKQEGEEGVGGMFTPDEENSEKTWVLQGVEEGQQLALIRSLQQ